MEIKFKLNFGHFVLSVISFIIAYMTITGTIQNYIKFASVLNEIGFFVISSMLGVLIFLFSFEKSKSK
jgi:hypothetical protein